MATFNYYLRDTNSVKPTPIVLFVSIDGKVSKISTGENIEPKYWDKKKQQARSHYTGSPELNKFLATYLLKAQANLRDFKADHDAKPSAVVLRKATELPKVKSGSEFKNALELFIETNKEFFQPSTIRKYQSLKNHLEEFEGLKRRVLTFDSIDIDFSDTFGGFLVNTRKQNNNTVSKYIKALKSFMQWATDRELHNNFAFKKFKAKEYSVDVIYLTEKEVLALLNHDLTKNNTLGRVRDAFCFGCFTGQRFSDIFNLRWEDIKNDTWNLHTKKTREIIEIPLNDYALGILKKYEGKPRPLEPYSNQKMNEYLKDLAGDVKLKEVHKLISYKGNKKEESTGLKQDLITTHTARRTFVTLSLEKGMRPETVMEITGHKDYKTLKRYIKITSKVKKIEMKKIWAKPRK